MNTTRTLALWVEDNEEIVKQKLPKLREIAAKHGCTVEVRHNCEAGKEFLENNEERIALVLLDLDLPVGDAPGAAGAPVGLELLKEYGYLPFIVFTANAQMVGEEQQELTPLAWVRKQVGGDDPDLIFTLMDEALNLATSDLVKTSTAAQHRTLACAEFRIQNYSIDKATPSNPVPWEVLGLKRGIELIAKETLANGGRVIAAIGCSVYCEFPADGSDPHHFQSALAAMGTAYQLSFGEQSSHAEFGAWYIPPFAIGFLPNHVNIVDQIPGGPHPELHALGRPAELVQRIAKGLSSGQMGLVSDWLEEGSQEEKHWQAISTPESSLSITLPYMTEPVTIIRKPVPRISPPTPEK